MTKLARDAPPPILRLEGITKRFGGVQALKGIDVAIPPGTIVALVGENGAGKSTLGNVIAGVHRPDGGRILVDDRPISLSSPRDALGHGVALVAQELAVVPEMSVVENVLLGYEAQTSGFIDNRSNRHRFEALQNGVGFQLDPDARAGSLRVADQQKVEILRALARNARIIVMDEPTATLTREEAQGLFAILRRLTSQGTSVVFVSHFLDDVLDISDTIVVLRNGEHVRTAPAAAETTDSLVSAMIGKHVDLSVRVKTEVPRSSPVVLAVRGLSGASVFSDISFEVKAGEVVGLAGLVGSGRTEVLRAIFGADRSTGDVTVDGAPVRRTHPRHAMMRGIGMVPESRKDEGLIMGQTIRENTTLASLPRHSRLGFISRRREATTTAQLSKQLGVRVLDDAREAPVVALSGGNQQKVLFAKWLAYGARVLLIDEPTRGVDIAAKDAIHQLIADVAARGVAVVVVSSEHEELIRLAHRVLVMRRGRVVEELTGDDLSEDRIVQASFGTVATQTKHPDMIPPNPDHENREVAI